MKGMKMGLLLGLLLGAGLYAQTAPRGMGYESDGNSITITEYSGSAAALVIPGTIQGLPVAVIGESAFFMCKSLTSVVIPNSVVVIGESAFWGCEKLTSVVIPNSVVVIGEDAFSMCESLTSVVIPNSVAVIGDGAFSGCDRLTSVVIPSSVTAIGKEPFVGDKLTSIQVDEGNPQYASIGGVLFTKDRTALIQYPTGKQDAAYTIPNSVAAIGDGAFSWCRRLTSVVIPNSVAVIGDGAFSGCGSLTSIQVDGGNPQYASVEGVLFTKDRTVLIQYPAGKQDAAYTIPNTVAAIGDGAFSWCRRLTSMVIPNSVNTIGNDAFYFCDRLTSVVIPSSVLFIGKSAFSHCEKLTSVVIPNSVREIGRHAFSYCTNLKSVILSRKTKFYTDEYSRSFPDGVKLTYSD